MHYQYDYIRWRTYFHPCKHAWVEAKFSDTKPELHSKICHENCRALRPENFTDSNHDYCNFGIVNFAIYCFSEFLYMIFIHNIKPYTI